MGEKSDNMNIAYYMCIYIYIYGILLCMRKGSESPLQEGAHEWARDHAVNSAHVIGIDYVTSNISYKPVRYVNSATSYIYTYVYICREGERIHVRRSTCIDLHTYIYMYTYK